MTQRVTGRVLIAAEGITEEHARALAEGTSLDVVVSENEERPSVAIDSLAHVLPQVWEWVRLVLESGAAAIELEAIIHRIRERKGRQVMIEVSKPPRLYQIPVDLGDDEQDPPNKFGLPQDEPYTDRGELRKALSAIDADQGR